MIRNKFDANRHKRILTEILIDVAKSLGPKIAFKGGTAAMLFGKLPRMSLDLDFDLFEDLNEEEKDIVEIVLRNHGEIKESMDKRYTLFYLLDYEKNFPNIKVEFNKRIWKNNSYENVSLLGVEIKIADQATSFSNKLVAISERRSLASRDLFDVYYFLKLGYPLKESLIVERTGKTLEEYVVFLKKFILGKFSKKNILEGLGEVLDEKQKDWAKDHLVEETINELDHVIKSL